MKRKLENDEESQCEYSEIFKKVGVKKQGSMVLQLVNRVREDCKGV